MPQIHDMGPTALLPLRRKACWGFFRPKNPTASAGFEPANLGTKGQHATPRQPKRPLITLTIFGKEQDTDHEAPRYVTLPRLLFFLLPRTKHTQRSRTPSAPVLPLTCDIKFSHPYKQARLDIALSISISMCLYSRRDASALFQFLQSVRQASNYLRGAEKAFQTSDNAHTQEAEGPKKVIMLLSQRSDILNVGTRAR